MKNFQSKLQRLRKAGLSQTDIAKFLGVSQSTLSRLASGKTKTLKYEVGLRLDRLARTQTLE
ncbi:helix-turn-helix domain-containing protein [Parasutterella excrementihominis]|uniref:helix-turn-helix domain-containing protein n=1 Tax=Parasutterella excrementihominis TaxID=487175 RepID=UPI003A936B35